MGVIPIGAQVTVAGLIWSHEKAFPSADLSFKNPAFWILQAILLCIAVCGNTLVDFLCGHFKDKIAATRVNLIIALLVVIIVAVVGAMLDKDVDWKWLGMVAVTGSLSLYLSYSVEMDLALAEAGMI
jgi:hypothetical protein